LRQLDAGIIRTPPAFKCPADITSVRLLVDPLVVAVDAFHPLRSRKQLKLADLKDERFIFYPRSYGIGIYDQFIKLCAARSFVPTIVQEAREASTIIGLVATGLGIAVVPSSLRYIGIPNIAYIPLSDADATTQLLLVYRAGEANTRVANLSQMARARTGLSAPSNETKLRRPRQAGRDEKNPPRKRKPQGNR
jgi:DNA-binding transcriptional LysR family regulator